MTAFMDRFGRRLPKQRPWRDAPDYLQSLQADIEAHKARCLAAGERIDAFLERIEHG